MSFYDADQQELIEKLAQELKKIKEIEPPAWAIFVKTGTHKERPPAKEDWWYVRAASVLRKVGKLGPIGVEKLRIEYGGKKRRGYASETVKKSGGSIIRKILQQLEKAELIKKSDKSIHKGRILTKKGRSFIDKIANSMIKQSKSVDKTEPKSTEEKVQTLVKKTEEHAKGENSIKKMLEETKKIPEKKVVKK